MIYKRIQKMRKAINIRLEESMLQELDLYAHELDRTRTYLIEKAVSQYFDTLDEMISDKRIDEIKAGNAKVYTLDEVVQKLGLE
jgi:predicted transcriptional regulator